MNARMPGRAREGTEGSERGRGEEREVAVGFEGSGTAVPRPGGGLFRPHHLGGVIPPGAVFGRLPGAGVQEAKATPAEQLKSNA